MKTRRTRLKLVYEGTDISRDIAGDFLSFEYTDNESGQADDVAITLKDSAGLWAGPWLPGKGDTIQATIVDEGFGELYCGRFSIDDLLYSLPPRQLQIKGVSVPVKKSIRRQKKSKAWEDANLEKIASEIADESGLSFVFDSPSSPQYDRIDQHEESDLEFINRLCSDDGLSLKITDNQLVIFSQSKYESQKAVKIIELGKANLDSINFETQSYDVYSECTVSYSDPTTEELIEYTFKDPNFKDGMKLKLVKRAASFADAERMAMSALRRKNKNETKASFTLAGDTEIVAGIVVALKGFGRFDGNYIIDTAKHTLSSGYKVQADARKVLEGY